MRSISYRVKDYWELPDLKYKHNDLVLFANDFEFTKWRCNEGSLNPDHSKDRDYHVHASWREESEKGRMLSRHISIQCKPLKNEFEIRMRPKGKLTQRHKEIISMLSALCLEVGVQDG